MSTTAPARRILIIDDEPGILEVLSHYLRTLNFDPFVTRKWTEALDHIAHHPPDLILLDLQMPTIQGEAILEHLRQEGLSIPVIVISAHLDPEREDRIRELGARGWIHKPFQLSKIADSIREELGLTTTEPEALEVEEIGPRPQPVRAASPAVSVLDHEIHEMTVAHPAPGVSPGPHGTHAHHHHHPPRRRKGNLRLYVIVGLACALASGIVLALTRLPTWLSGSMDQALEKSMQSELRRQAKGMEKLSDKEKEGLRKSVEGQGKP